MLQFLTRLVPHARKILLPLHALFLVSLFLLPSISSGYYWLILLGWTLFSGVGVSAGYHRYFSHKAFEASTFAKYLMAACGIFGGQGSAIFWVAMHRGYHHPHSDTLKDLHSPIHGKWSAYMGWMFKITDRSVNLKYAVDLLRDPMHLYIHKHYTKLFWIPIILLALVSWQAAICFFIIPVFMAQHQENLVDLFCHIDSWGSYKNFDTGDWSVNHPLLGWFGWGQGWHNNHHHAPGSCDFGSSVSGKWWELDPCRILTFALSR